jgi:hypothetical protein
MPGQSCERCGRHVWLVGLTDPGWFERPPGSLPDSEPEHTPERCRWWRGDPSTSWGEPPGNK